MVEPAIQHRPLSVEDYLAIEEMSLDRHEYVSGRMHALAGATKQHNTIAGNIFARLHAAAGGGPCRIYTSDVTLQVTDDVFYYPDVMVASGPSAGDPRIETAPCMVVEVVSPSTATIDRREKLTLYKRIPTLKAYLIVDQEMRRVERHWRGEDGSWWDADLVGGGRIPVPCPEAELSMDEVYAGISFEAQGAA